MVRDALTQLLSRPLFAAVVGVQSVLLAVVVIAHLARLPDVRVAPEPETGDFLAFWVGGRMIALDRGASLYDPDAQQVVQEETQAGPRPYRQVWLNPPALALAVAPTTALGYDGAYLVFCAAMAASFAASVAMARGMVPRLVPDARSAWVLAAALFAIPSVARAVGGGQNTMLSLAGLVGAAWAARGGPEWVGGLALGVLTYKPQYALVAVLALVWGRRWRALGLGAGLGLAHYAAGALWCGWDWPVAFLRNGLAYGGLEAAEDQRVHISLPRALAVLLGPVGSVLGYAAALGLVVASRRNLAALLVAGLLAMPHLQYYDASLVIVPVLLALDARYPELRTKLALVGLVLGIEAQGVFAALGFQPIPWLFVALWFGLWRWGP